MYQFSLFPRLPLPLIEPNHLLMPIRMVDDPQDQDNSSQESGGGGSSNFPGGGGGGGLFNLLPLLLGLFRGKGIILLLILAAGGWFLSRQGGCNMSQIAQLATGGKPDPRQRRRPGRARRSLGSAGAAGPCPAARRRLARELPARRHPAHQRGRLSRRALQGLAQGRAGQ